MSNSKSCVEKISKKNELRFFLPKKSSGPTIDRSTRKTPRIFKQGEIMRGKVRALLLLSLLLNGCDNLNFKAARDQKSHNWSLSTLSQLKTNLSGNVDSSLLGNYQAITFDVEKKELVLNLPAPNLFQNWERTLTKLPGVVLKASTNSQEQSLLQLHYPLHFLVSKFDANYGDKTGLPNGQALPGISGGKLFVEKIIIDKTHQVHIFFDKGMVGMLLSVPYDPMIVTTIPIKKTNFGTSAENILGFTNTIPKGNSEFGGLLLTAIVPPTSLNLLERE